MSDVFVSYKAEDRRRVQPLVQALQADGYSVWWDEHIGTGDEWRHTIEQQLESASCVVVIWSKRSIGPEGHFVRDEASRAQRRHVYVPVLIDAVEPPLGFGERQATSLRGWRGDRTDSRYQAVLAAVGRVAGDGKRQSVRRAVAQAPVSRRAVVGGGAVAAVAIAGVGAWALLKPGSATAADSIAVLPFANLSGDPAQQYFSDGIAEELRSALVRLAGLKVVGRTSSEAVRNEDAETAAKRLGVPNVLTGSVRRSPATVRVSAQLIDGTNGMERWSDSYDRAPGDTIKIQTEIAENVARSLSIALGSAGRKALTAGGTQNAAAQNLVLQADELIHDFTRETYHRALGLLDAAIALDPSYARAYGLKAYVLLGLANRFSRSGNELDRGRTEALRNARKAVELAPNLPTGHGALAQIYQSRLQLGEVAKQYQQLMHIASGDPDVLRGYAGFLSGMGQSAEALRLANQALALDRLNPWSYRTRAFVLFEARRYAEVVRSAEQRKRESPELFDFHLTLGDALTMLGRFEEARHAFAQEGADDLIRLAGEAILAARAGDRRTAVAKMEKIEQMYGEAASYQYAQIHASLGNVDQAFTALHRAWQIKDPGLFSTKVDPTLDPLRRDLRFAALLGRIGFPA